MEKDIYESTNPQKSIWLTEKYYEGTAVNNILGYIHITESVDFDVLKKSINEFVKSNDAMRLQFSKDNTSCIQYLSEYSEFDIDIIELSSEKEIETTALKLASIPFEVENNPLVKFTLFKLPNNHGGIFMNIHHLISDSWSLGLISKEVINIYSDILKNTYIGSSCPSYLDYLKSEQKYLTSEKAKKDKDYWDEIFKTVPEVASIPSYKNQISSEISCKGNRLIFNLSQDEVNKITKFCKENSISLYNFFMSVYSLYIGRVSNLDDFVIGTPILNRTNIEQKNTIGMFVSTVPLRINLDNNISFTEFVKNIANNTMSALRHQKYPYQFILENIRKKNSSIPNLYNIFLSYQITKSVDKNSDIKCKTNWVFNGCCADELQIHLFDLNNESCINIAYDYKTDKYDKQDITDLHSRILTIINQILNNSNTSLKDIEIVTSEERNKILYKFNNTYMDYPRDKTIVDLFEEQVQKTPNNIAVVFENQQLTYKQLNEKANSLSHYLINNGVGHGDTIGIMVPRSLEMIISIIAVLKSGACYIPIDPEYPESRIEYMLEDSKANLLLTFKNLNSEINFSKKVFVELDNSFYTSNIENPPHVNKPDDLVYIIYTSGSTGKPKGVMLKHKNIVNFIFAMLKEMKFSSNSTIISITTISFDIFVLESLLPLSSGMKIVIASKEAQTNIQLFSELCKKHNVEIIQSTPTRFQTFLSNLPDNFLNNIKYLLIGGEPFPDALLENLHSVYKGKIYNMYGPTETAVWSSVKDLSSTNTITIGKPIANTQMYVLNKLKKVVPYGVAGEIYISGDGVSNGYLNRPELTQNSFTPNPFEPDKTLYNTGDIGYFMSDGEIMCLGRNDSQVKIRGLRIELGEIENCISSFPNIGKSVVIVNNDNQLVSYFSSDKTINLKDLKAYLQRKLPSYFIPTFFVQTDNFPLTPNGKIDKKVLRKQKLNIESEYEEPHTEYQKTLVELFKDVLKLDKIGINDNFFELGGDSLSAIQLQVKAFNQGLELSYKSIFSSPTIKQLSESNFEKSEPISEENYDYTEINNLLAQNSISDNYRIKKEKIKNILLTGSTGFVGSHVLAKLLTQTKCNIYCLIRTKNNIDSKTRLLDILKFYFGKKYNKYISKRIFIIDGDISDNHFGLNDTDYSELGKNIDCVINSAALVKHYGQLGLFNKVNVIGVQNIIDFCSDFETKLIHLSTLSVSGNITDSNEFMTYSEQKQFSEQNLYINQDLSNVYVRTKFIAERLILEKIIKDNLNAKIIRLGNITNRFSDGAFQINISENAFLNRLTSFLKLGCFPDYLADNYFEFTPVDICADAIVKLTMHKNPFTVFHLYNNNYVFFNELPKLFDKLHIPFKVVSKDEFNDKVKEFLNDESRKNEISSIIRDYKNNKELQYYNNIHVENNFTNKFLKKLLFKWPKINEKYTRKFMAYLKSINYI